MDGVNNKSKHNDSASALDKRGTGPQIHQDESKSKTKSTKQKYVTKLKLDGVETNIKNDSDDGGSLNDEITAKYSVQILGTDLKKNKGEKSFTAYKIEITRDVSSWLIYRRYSQFFSLLGELKSAFGIQKVPKKFPPKKIKQNLSPENIDRRHKMLEEWLTAVLADPELRQHESVQIFVKQGKEDVDFVPRQRSAIISDIDIQSSLYKLHNGKWKDRHFVLRHGLLYKYESKDAKHPFNFYDLREASATNQEEKSPKAKTNLFTFTVQVPDRKKKHVISHFFAAETEELRNNWIALINREARLNTSNKVFGVALEDVRERDENGVPLFVSALLTFLLATAHDRDDLFTQPPDETMKKSIDEGQAIDLQSVANDAHAVAGLVVQYLHELPHPIIKHEYQDCLFGIFKIQDESKQQKMFHHFSEILPIVNRNLLIKLFSFLCAISKPGETKRERLVKIFGRLVIRPASEIDHVFLTNLVNQMIDNWKLLEVEGEKYVPVLVMKKRAGSVKTSTENSLAKKESKRNLAESNKDINSDKLIKDPKTEQNQNADVDLQQKDGSKSPRKDKHKKDKENKDKASKTVKSPRKKDDNNKNDKNESVKSPRKDKQTKEEQKYSKNETKNEQNDESKSLKVEEKAPKVEISKVDVSAVPSTDVKSDVAAPVPTSPRDNKIEVKVLSQSTSTKSTRRGVDESFYEFLEKNPEAADLKVEVTPAAEDKPNKEILPENGQKTDEPNQVKKDDDSKSKPKVQFLGVNDTESESESSGESDSYQSFDSHDSSTSEASIDEHVQIDSTVSVPKIELDSQPIENIAPNQDKESSDDEGELGVLSSPRLSMTKRIKSTKNKRPTSARVSIPPGAIPPTIDDHETEQTSPRQAPSIVVISPQQQLMADLNKALGNRLKQNQK